jgi:hypothetical protein
MRKGASEGAKRTWDFENQAPSFPDVQLHIVDAPLGAGPE